MEDSISLKKIKPIKNEEETLDICFNPTHKLLATAHINGNINLHSYKVIKEETKLLKTFKTHTKACRKVKFDSCGSNVYSISSDKSLVAADCNQGDVSLFVENAHESPIYSIHIIDDKSIATGDDDGVLKIWDLRSKKSTLSFHESSDSITDMICDNHNRLLIVTSAEGTLSVFDIRKSKLKIQSELMDSGLQSIAALKEYKKIVCGSEDGILNFFNWGEWGNISDRYPGHSNSIEKIIPLMKNKIIIASDSIRIVNIFPNKTLSIIGEHSGFPIEGMSLSKCKKWIASCSHDQFVRFWNICNISRKVIKSSKCDKEKKNRISLLQNPVRNKFYSDLVEEMTTENNIDNKC